MPELPEIEHLVRLANTYTRDSAIEGIEIGAISAIKTADPPIDSVIGATISEWTRRGKYLIAEINPNALFIVIHLSRGGWMRWNQSRTTPAEGKVTFLRGGKSNVAVRLQFTDGDLVFTEAGTQKRFALWLVKDPNEIHHVGALGPDPLSEEFTVSRLSKILQSTNSHLKTVLADQSLIAGVGNAYSDEALWLAKLSPYAKSSSLTETEVAALHDAIVNVLREAIDRAGELNEKELKSDKKSNLQVHNRKDELCPRCGDTIREVSLSSKSFQYCPTCQTKGKILADRRMSKLLK